MPFLMFLPALFPIIEKVVGYELDNVKKTSIVSGLLSSVTNSVPGLLQIIEGSLGQLTNIQRMELEVQLQTLVSANEVNKVEAQRESFFISGWRPFLAWGLSILVIFHLMTAEAWNIIALIHGVPLAPMDNITLALLCGLLGIYMGARTVEKVNSNMG